MGDGHSREELEALHCWENDDHVPGRPGMTEFRRTVRVQQARWREAHGHPMGSQPIVPAAGKPSRPVGSRLPLDYARETGANFLTARAGEAVRARTSVVERHQTLDHQRLWAELLWSPALAFNLFGELAADLALADEAVHAWWPDAPGSVVDVTYHEWMKPETPKPSNLARYLEVAERSGAFESGATDQVKGRSGLAVMWLEHLLLLSMLQHASGVWSWGRYVVLHPAGNSDYAEGCERYRSLLANGSTFAAMTLEGLLDAGVIPARTSAALRERYLRAARSGR